VINAGGIISVWHEYDGNSSDNQVQSDVEKIPLRLTEIFEESKKTGRPTNELADELARRLIAA
ncbi:MAG: amino acid dehydrogenase, partial [Pseudomonadota bacterium]